MDRATLRATQAPLKDRYRSEPDAALVTLRAEGTLACSGDMLLEALVACAGVTLRSVATSLEIPVTGAVRAEGDLDFRGTLGVASADEAPVGFRAIRLRFDLEGEATEEQLATLLRLTERYCVVLQTLAAGVPVTVSRS